MTTREKIRFWIRENSIYLSLVFSAIAVLAVGWAVYANTNRPYVGQTPYVSKMIAGNINNTLCPGEVLSFTVQTEIRAPARFVYNRTWWNETKNKTIVPQRVADGQVANYTKPVIDPPLRSLITTTVPFTDVSPGDVLRFDRSAMASGVADTFFSVYVKVPENCSGLSR